MASTVLWPRRTGLPSRAVTTVLISRNFYDSKLAAAFQRYQHPPLPDITVRTAQMLLNYVGFNTGGIDGIVAAAQGFREEHGMGSSNEIDDELINALRAA